MSAIPPLSGISRHPSNGPELPRVPQSWRGFEFRGAEDGVSSAPDLQAGERRLRCPIGEAVSLYAPQILGIATCNRLRHRWCIRCHWCFHELSAADRVGGRCRDCCAVVRRAGLAMAAFAGARPRGDAGRWGTSILAAGGWSNCCLRHASAEDWTALKRRRNQAPSMTRPSKVQT